MVKKIVFFFILLIANSTLQSQTLDDYKYVVVPSKFDFQKEANQHKINNLTRFLLAKYGFDAYLQGEALPSDLNVNGCNTLYAHLEEGGFLSTNIILSLLDCRGEVVYTSPEGKSKIKEFEPAYNEALREAFLGFETLGYTYSDEIVQAPVFTKEKTALDYAENITPTKKQTTPVKQPQKTVVVSAVPKENTVKEAPQKIKENKDVSSIPVVRSSTNASVNYTSADGAYMLKPSNQGFDVYEDDSKIGTATKTAAGVYLISTTQFNGVGYLQDEQFVIEREIKGVQGLVKMIFTVQD